jgi:Undecaprenyl-phosphate glucose phosphotransferase
MTDIGFFTRPERDGRSPSNRRRGVYSRRNFPLLAMAGDFLIISVVAALAGFGYHFAVYGYGGQISSYLETVLVIAPLYIGQRLLGHRYSLNSHISGDERPGEHFMVWNNAMFGLLVIAFLLGHSALFSRGAVILFYFAGFVSLSLFHRRLASHVQRLCRQGRISSRHVMLVGAKKRIDGFMRHYRPGDHGMRVRHMIELDNLVNAGGRKRAELDELLARAAALSRRDRVDDVILLLPWSRRELAERCVEFFQYGAAYVHLGPQAIFERFADARLTHLGPVNTLNVVRPPLSMMEVYIKRMFDVAASLVGLVLLSPALALFALLIKLDDGGPVFFRQKRHGFNHEPFEILKFRTMSVMEDGEKVVQARKDDPRITRIGRFMRRWNIDELPQLINVLKGDMSLVGPRPHAMAHDHEFAARIANYARRMNVQPGITGLAQINGYRGPTDTDEKIRKRLEQDLHYIDNWSFWLDLYIIWMTVFSKKAYRNAH